MNQGNAAIRNWPIQIEIERNVRQMTPEQLRGATSVLNSIWSHLHDTWFVQHEEFDRRAFIKTLEELTEICHEIRNNPNRN